LRKLTNVLFSKPQKRWSIKDDFWDSLGDGEIELVDDVDVLEDDGIGAVFLDRVEAGGAAGEYDDGNVNRFRPGFDGGDQFATGHSGHLEISDDDVRGDVVQDIEGLGTVGGGLDKESALLEITADGVADQHGIVNHNG
jgi:hypothetical protein